MQEIDDMTQFTNARGCTIGMASRQTGVNIETIRYYERIGILPQPERTKGGNRLYDKGVLKRMIFIRRSRELGLSLDEIRTLLEMTDREDFTCAEVHEMTARHLANVRKKIEDLKQLASALDDMVSKCSQGDVPKCPVIDVLSRCY